MSRDPRVARVATFYERLAPDRLAQLDVVYTQDVRFTDPFHDVHGLPAVRAIFRRMYERLHEPRFVVCDGLAEGSQGFVTWEFRFAWRDDGRAPVCVRGASHLRFAADGRVAVHRDYWDAAGELYAQLPAVGGLMRWLRRRIAG